MHQFEKLQVLLTHAYLSLILFMITVLPRTYVKKKMKNHMPTMSFYITSIQDTSWNTVLTTWLNLTEQTYATVHLSRSLDSRIKDLSSSLIFNSCLSDLLKDLKNIRSHNRNGFTDFIARIFEIVSIPFHLFSSLYSLWR